MSLQNLLDEVERLPTAEKWQLVRHLLDDLEAEKKAVSREGWANFVNRMYGALADDPIQRYEQGEYEEREPLE